MEEKWAAPNTDERASAARRVRRSLAKPNAFFWAHRFLAVGARRDGQIRPRAGGTAGFCFVRPLTATLRVCGFPKKQTKS